MLSRQRRTREVDPRDIRSRLALNFNSFFSFALYSPRSFVRTEIVGFPDDLQFREPCAFAMLYLASNLIKLLRNCSPKRRASRIDTTSPQKG